MTRDTLHRVRQTVRQSRLSASAVACALLLVLSIVSGVAVAQQQEQVFTDDFEDETVDGWDGGNPQAVQDGFHGEWSLEVEDGFQGQTAWQSGPLLDLGEEFRVEGTVKSTAAQTNPDDRPRRIGLFESFGEGVMLVFRSDQNTTFLATDVQESPSDVDDTISSNFDDVWVDFVIESDGEGTVRAKVWESGTTEPSTFQLERNFDPIAGQFAIEPGQSDDVRVYNLDEVEITGYEAVAENLTIETSSLLRHGERNAYEIKLEEYDESQGRNVTRDVTDEANVTSLNTSGITVDEQTNELVATSDEAFNDRVTIRAEHPNVTGAAFKEVTVATVEMANLDVLPPVYRIAAFLGDWTIFLLFISIGAGIIGTRVATSFMGLSMMEIVLIIGWFGGYLSLGLMLVSVFACLFIGLNLAANIDYQVQR